MKYLIPLSFIIAILLIGSQGCNDDKYIKGKLLYEGYCSNCHMDDGGGLQLLIPPLTDIDYLLMRKDVIPCSIKYGIEGELTIGGKTYDEPMPENIGMTDQQITEIMNYIFNVINDGKTEITAEEVNIALSNCP